MAKNYISPQISPREDAELGSTYALQIALRNLKERYQKLQRKMSFIEEENQQLVSGKNELFGEIGVIQESSIKLREKNLQLNQEVHKKHQENCSLRDNNNSLSHQNVTLLNDKKRLQSQVSQLLETNRSLQERINSFNGGKRKISPNLDAEGRALSPDSITPTPFPPTDSHSDDSIEPQQWNEGLLESVKKPQHSWKAMFEATEDASDTMDKIMDEIQRQNIALQELLLTATAETKDTSSGSLVSSQKDRDLSTLTVENSQLEGQAANRHLLTDHAYVSEALIGAEDLVAANHMRANSPYDWRKEKGSDEEQSSHSEEESEYSSDTKTSPTLKSPPSKHLSPSHHISPSTALDDDAKVCPMCNRCFSRETTQDMFENHVIAHFEDINIGFEVT